MNLEDLERFLRILALLVLIPFRGNSFDCILSDDI